MFNITLYFLAKYCPNCFITKLDLKNSKKLTLCYSSSNQLRPECHCQKSCISSKVGSASYSSATAIQDRRNRLGKGAGIRPLKLWQKQILLHQNALDYYLSPRIFRPSYGPATTTASECMYVPELLLTTLWLIFIKNHPKIMKTLSEVLAFLKQGTMICNYFANYILATVTSNTQERQK